MPASFIIPRYLADSPLNHLEIGQYSQSMSFVTRYWNDFGWRYSWRSGTRCAGAVIGDASSTWKSTTSASYGNWYHGWQSHLATASSLTDGTKLFLAEGTWLYPYMNMSW